MKRIIPILLIFCGLHSFAQSYADQIAKHRESYKEDFLKEANSPLRKADLKNLDFFEADSTFKVKAVVKTLKNEQVFKMPTHDGGTSNYYRFARVNFVFMGKDYQLTLYKSISLNQNPLYKDLLFLPFTDETNNTETYGGGRYIDLSENDLKNDTIEIDFNKAYNPYCAYSTGYRCPVPPAENDLEIAIRAGEKLYKGKIKH